MYAAGEFVKNTSADTAVEPKTTYIVTSCCQFTPIDLRPKRSSLWDVGIMIATPLSSTSKAVLAQAI